jgi:predicted transcriptional regulator
MSSEVEVLKTENNRLKEENTRLQAIIKELNFHKIALDRGFTEAIQNGMNTKVDLAKAQTAVQELQQRYDETVKLLETTKQTEETKKLNK